MVKRKRRRRGLVVCKGSARPYQACISMRLCGKRGSGSQSRMATAARQCAK